MSDTEGARIAESARPPTPHKVLVRHLEDDHRLGRCKHLSLADLRVLHAQMHEQSDDPE